MVFCVQDLGSTVEGLGIIIGLGLVVEVRVCGSRLAVSVWV